QIEEAWYRELVQQHHIHGGEDCGRDNTIFTLSLANYQSGITFELCLNKMDQFNSMLERPLKNKEVEKTVKSAYSGKYRGASREYLTTDANIKNHDRIVSTPMRKNEKKILSNI